jgi:hypothetical protein
MPTGHFIDARSGSSPGGATKNPHASGIFFATIGREAAIPIYRESSPDSMNGVNAYREALAEQQKAAKHCGFFVAWEGLDFASARVENYKKTPTLEFHCVRRRASEQFEPCTLTELWLPWCVCYLQRFTHGELIMKKLQYGIEH